MRVLMLYKEEWRAFIGKFEHTSTKSNALCHRLLSESEFSHPTHVLKAQLLARTNKAGEIGAMDGGIEQLLSVVVGGNSEHRHAAAYRFPDGLVTRADNHASAPTEEALE